MANSKKLAANINFVVDNLTTIGVIKEAKAFVKALNKDKATKEYLAEDFISWIGDELRECEDLIGTNYGYEVILDENSSSVVYDHYRTCAYVQADVFVRRHLSNVCGCATFLRTCLGKTHINKNNDTLSFGISRCYRLDIEDGEIKEITRHYPTY